MSSKDENLLFAIIAVQLDFINASQMAEAASIWMVSKERPIGEVLVERKYLTDEDRRFLDRVVQKHVERSGSPVKSLESLTRHGTTVDLQRELQRSGVDLALPPKVKAASDASGSTQLLVGVRVDDRYHMLRDLAQGGLGKISVARDGHLDREVAIKEMLERLVSNSDARARFVNEAKVTGSLEHPGIVPIYSLGAFSDGRPYYSMRLIRGTSLADAINRIHFGDSTGEHYVHRIRPLLRHLVDACNTIAYAHSRGVLHRDIKPANIMLGKFGETIVVDWGLAKPLGTAPTGNKQSEPPILDPSGSGSQPTAYGSVLGTPAYMSPEQANGQSELVDVRSDVFSLGATLYSILVGQAPFEGSTRQEILMHAQQNAFAPPLQRNRLVPKELNAICLKAMSTKPADRYPETTELAEDINRWIAGEPVAALPEGIGQKIERFSRRHQTALISSLLVLSATVGGLVWFNRELRKERDSASVAKLQAVESRVMVSAILEDLIDKLADDKLAQVPGMDQKRMEMLDEASERFEELQKKYPKIDEIRMNATDILMRSANVDRRMKQVDRAYEKMNRILKLLDELPQDQRQNETWIPVLVDTLFYKAQIEGARSGSLAARPIVRQNIDLSSRFAKLFPGEIGPSVAAARVRLQLSDLEKDTSQFVSARDLAREAIDFLTGVHSDAQPNKGVVLYLTSAWLLRAMCEVELGDWGAAQQSIVKGREFSEILEREEFSPRDSRLFNAKFDFESARIALKSNDLPGFLQATDRALDALRTLEMENPNSSSYPNWIATVTSERAHALSKSSSTQAQEELTTSRAARVSALKNGLSAEDERKLNVRIAKALTAIATQVGRTDFLLEAQSELDRALQVLREDNPNSPLLRNSY